MPIPEFLEWQQMAVKVANEIKREAEKR